MIGHPPARSGDTVTIPFEVGPDEHHEATFLLPPGTVLDGRADAALTAALLPAMRRGLPLAIDGPVSQTLLAAVERIADIWLTWDRTPDPSATQFHRVPVDASNPVTGAELTDERGRACFFTGGVDSFFSALRHRDELDALIFVHGFDLYADRTHPLNRQVVERLRDAATAMGLPLLEVQCNLVAFSTAFEIGWEDYHGAALATVAHLLADRFSTVLVPASTTYADLYPLGSHPLLDPLWSTDRVQIVHDGADASRIDKLKAIAGEPPAQQHLRVCFLNPDDQYNCGRCEKCVRTGVAIRIAGVEGAFTSLGSPSLRDVAQVAVPGRGTAWRSYRDELARTGANERLRRSIDLALLRRRFRQSALGRRWPSSR